MQVLQKWFAYWMGVMLVLIALYALFGPKGKAIDLQEINFQTTQSSLLYFKNVRSFSYEIEENETAKLSFYRIKSRVEDSSSNHLSFLLVNNWLFDECYVMTEAFGQLKEQGDIQLFVEHADFTDTLFLSVPDNEDHYRFAAGIYEGLNNDAAFFFAADGKKLPLWTEKSERKSSKKTLSDYFKLVGKIR